MTIDSKSGTRRRLNSGDMITLLCPKRVKDSPEILDRATYTFLLGGSLSASISNGASRPQAKAVGGLGGSGGGGGAESSSPLEYSFTSALHSNRVVTAHYELQHWNELGRGQFGVVFRAVHRQTGVVWACKQLDIRKAAFSSDIDTLMNEVRVLKGLKHPSIIGSEDVFQDASSLFIIQPLCEGGDLFDRIVDKHPGGYPEDLARELVARLTKAVQFLHAKEIVHRDLKPENILLSSLGSDIDIKITDFGLAKRDAACKTFCGTPAYFAPEVLQRQRTVLGQG